MSKAKVTMPEVGTFTLGEGTGPKHCRSLPILLNGEPTGPNLCSDGRMWGAGTNEGFRLTYRSQQDALWFEARGYAAERSLQAEFEMPNAERLFVMPGSRRLTTLEFVDEACRTIEMLRLVAENAALDANVKGTAARDAKGTPKVDQDIFYRVSSAAYAVQGHLSVDRRNIISAI